MSDRGEGGHKRILLRFHTTSPVSPLVLDGQCFALVLAQVQVHFSSAIFSYDSQTSSTVTGLLLLSFSQPGNETPNNFSKEVI